MGNQQKSCAITENDIKILSKVSGKTDDEIREWYNDFLNDCQHTGQMNKRQFQVFYTKLKKNPNLEIITDHIFRAFDSDHSGKFQLDRFYF